MDIPPNEYLKFLTFMSCSFQLVLSNPTAGNWGPWSLWWPDCDYVPEGTPQNRVRQCNSPPPSGGGAQCSGPDEENWFCPIDGQWDSWGNWGDCNHLCGKGIRKRFRECTTPPPTYGGKACAGPNSDTEECFYWDFENCPGDCTTTVCNHLERSHCQKNDVHKEGFICSCINGYEYSTINGTCQDINECSRNPCSANQWCENKAGGYKCFCKGGYRLDQDSGNCVLAFKEKYCSIQRNQYQCACQHNTEGSSKYVVFNPEKTNLHTAPSPVTIQSGAERCVCYFCKQRISEIDYNPDVSRCSTIEEDYPRCKENTGVGPQPMPYIDSTLFNATETLEKIDSEIYFAANMTQKEFNTVVEIVAQDSIAGCLNSDKLDKEASNAMTLLYDCDRAGHELIAAIEENIPRFTIDVRASETETESAFRLYQNNDNTGYVFHCNSSMPNQNFITVPKIAFVRDKQPVLSTCIDNPRDVLLLSTSVSGFEFETGNSSTQIDQVNSPVISTTTWPRVLRLPEEHLVTIHFKLSKVATEEWYPTCGWYDFERKIWRLHSDEEYSGCTINFQNNTDVTCACNHLTNFAIIMKDRQVIKEKPELDVAVITGAVISLIASLIALILLALTCIVRFSQQTLYRMVSAVLCSSFNITFLVGSTNVFNKSSCKITATLLLMFHTSITYWAVGFILLTFYRIRSGSAIETKLQYTFLVVFSSALPFCLTPIIVGSKGEQYLHHIYCWPSGDTGTAIGALFPVFLLAAIGGLFLLCTSRIISNYRKRLDSKILLTKKENMSQDEHISNRERVQELIILLVLHVFIWLMFMINARTLHSSTMYLFSVLNTLEALVSAILFLLVDDKIRLSIVLVVQCIKQRDRSVISEAICATPVENISLNSSSEISVFKDTANDNEDEFSLNLSLRPKTAITPKDIVISPDISNDGHASRSINLNPSSHDRPSVRPKTSSTMIRSSSVNPPLSQAMKEGHIHKFSLENERPNSVDINRLTIQDMRRRRSSLTRASEPVVLPLDLHDNQMYHRPKTVLDIVYSDDEDKLEEINMEVKGEIACNRLSTTKRVNDISHIASNSELKKTDIESPKENALKDTLDTQLTECEITSKKMAIPSGSPDVEKTIDLSNSLQKEKTVLIQKGLTSGFNTVALNAGMDSCQHSKHEDPTDNTITDKHDEGDMQLQLVDTEKSLPNIVSQSQDTRRDNDHDTINTDKEADIFPHTKEVQVESIRNILRGDKFAEKAVVREAIFSNDGEPSINPEEEDTQANRKVSIQAIEEHKPDDKDITKDLRTDIELNPTRMPLPSDGEEEAELKSKSHKKKKKKRHKKSCDDERKEDDSDDQPDDKSKHVKPKEKKKHKKHKKHDHDENPENSQDGDNEIDDDTHNHRKHKKRKKKKQTHTDESDVSVSGNYDNGKKNHKKERKPKDNAKEIRETGIPENGNDSIVGVDIT